MGPVPRLHQYYAGATTSYCHLAALRFLRLAIPRMHSFVRSLAVECGRQSLELVTRCLQPGIAEEQKSRTLPSSWGTSIFRLPCSKPTPAGLLASDHCDAAAWPLVIEWQRLPRKVFRRSIAWLSDSLSTLRSAGYPTPRKTRFQLLVRLCWTGFPPARFR